MVTKIKRLKDGKLFNQLSGLNLSRGEQFTSTKSSKSSGKWYFEITHFMGSNYDYAGFLHAKSNNELVFYTRGEIDNPYYWTSGIFSEKTFNIEHLNFPVDSQHTIGVGIDIDKQTFSIFYKYFIKSFNIISFDKETAFNIDIGCGDNINANYDVISVNFGAAPFIYQAEGYRPWSSSLALSNCSNRRNYIMKCSLMSNLIFIQTLCLCELYE